jgi:hypothetical protein
VSLEADKVKKQMNTAYFSLAEARAGASFVGCVDESRLVHDPNEAQYLSASVRPA